MATANLAPHWRPPHLVTRHYELERLPADVRERVKPFIDLGISIRELEISSDTPCTPYYNLLRTILLDANLAKRLKVTKYVYLREVPLLDKQPSKMGPGLVLGIEKTIGMIPVDFKTPVGTRYKLDITNTIENPKDPHCLEITTDDLVLETPGIPADLKPFASCTQIAIIHPYERYSADIVVVEAGDDMKIPAVDNFAYILSGSPRDPEETRTIAGARIRTISRGNPVDIVVAACDSIIERIAIVATKDLGEFSENDECILSLMQHIILRENPDVGLVLINPEDEKRRIIHLNIKRADAGADFPSADAQRLLRSACTIATREISELRTSVASTGD
jgi:hypothetical protein